MKKKIITISIMLLSLLLLVACGEKEVKYKVTFNPNNGNNTFVVEVPKGNLLGKPANEPTKEGFVFESWQKNGVDYTFTTPVEEDFTLTAKWREDIVKYTVTFVDFDGSIIETVLVNENEEIILPESPKREGFLFSKWDKDLSNITSDLTVYAEYVLETFIVTFKDYDGSIIEQTTVNYNKNATEPTEPSREGHTFIKWDKEFTNVKEDLTITAIYSINTYTVSFNTNGAGTIDDISGEYDSLINYPNDPEKIGYTFLGWGKDAPEKFPSTNLTLEAQWDINYYDIFYDLNEGENDPNNPSYYTVEENIVLLDATKEGYQFLGWYDEEDNVVETIEKGSTYHLVLEARWTVKEFTVIFKDLDGNIFKTEEVLWGEDATAPDNFNIVSYEFGKWDIDFTNVMGNLEVYALPNLVISKLFTGVRIQNNIIELYNNTNSDIDLSSYSISFFADGSETITSSVNLSGTITANGYYAIAYSGFDYDEFGVDENLIDLKTGVLPFNGDDAVSITNNNVLIDIVGYTTGFTLEFSRFLTLIKLGTKDSYTPNNSFDQFSYISYLPEKFEYLKNNNHKIQTLEDLYAGPRLSEEFKNRPYSADNKGTGGALLVTSVASIADGDTATFNYPGKGNTASHRYYYIDTPEVDGGNVSAEPWGYVASKYNKEFILSNWQSKTIYVQSVPNYGLTETYGRNIGLIWINDSLSQFLTISEGLSVDVPVMYTDIDRELYWEDVPYLTFMKFAEERARQNGWGLHGYPKKIDGEKAPDWNYNTNSKNTSFTWEPHLSMPWE